jgi:L-amino acid N-acyltransferase YncA
MEIVLEKESMNFEKIRSLVIQEWPTEFGNMSDDEKIMEFEKTKNDLYDINKYLVENDKSIGWYRYSKWPRDVDNNDNAHTLDIVVDNSHRGKGLGKMMMKDLIEDCRSKGYKNLKSRTFFTNIGSIELHKKIGFHEAFRTADSIVWEINL